MTTQTGTLHFSWEFSRVSSYKTVKIKINLAQNRYVQKNFIFPAAQAAN